MSRVPMGKVLLRNVIRHTDAHNKIQEESEMWKLRDMEKHTPPTQPTKHRWTTAAPLTRGHMHCDRYLDDSAVSTRDRLGDREHSSDREEREARYWTRKLYQFEASDPDRWGHSGFKELYPEEFRTDGEKNDAQRKKKKCKVSLETDRRKRSKKSSKKKKKRKEKKKRPAESGSESSSSEGDGVKRKPRREKSKGCRKKTDKSKGKADDSSSEDCDSEGGGEKRTRASRKRRRQETELETRGKRRKDGKETNMEKSEESAES